MGRPSLRQLSTTERIAATFGPACAQPSPTAAAQPDSTAAVQPTAHDIRLRVQAVRAGLVRGLQGTTFDLLNLERYGRL
jgi:hypothetical protein